MKKYRFSTEVLLNFFFILFVAIMLCSCGSGGGGGSNGDGDSSSGETTTKSGFFDSGADIIVTSKTIGAAGGTIEAGNSGTPIDGVKVTFPEGALPADTNVSLGYNSGTLNYDGDNGSAVALILDTEVFEQFEKPVSITVPFSDSSKTPVPFYVDESGELHAAMLVNIDRDARTFTFDTLYSSWFTWIIYPKVSTKGSGDIITTDFRPEKYGFNIQNKNRCLGISAFSIWYFVNKKSEGNLFTYDLTRQETIATSAHDNIGKRWKDRYVSSIVSQYDYVPQEQIWDSLRCIMNSGVSGTPVILILIKTSVVEDIIRFFNKDYDAGVLHAVVAYAVNESSGAIHIYDPNYPGKTQIMYYNASTGKFNYDNFDFSKVTYLGSASFIDLDTINDFKNILGGTVSTSASGSYSSGAGAAVSPTTGVAYGILHANSATGPALAVATVVCDKKYVTTASNGSFSIQGLSPGTQTIAFSKNGYVYYERSITITAGQSTNVGDRWLEANSQSAPKIDTPNLAINELSVRKPGEDDTHHKLELKPGEKYYIKVKISNVGKAEATKAYTITYLLSDDSKISYDDQIIDSETDKEDIDAGDTHKNGRNVYAPSIPGIYYVGARVDSPEDMDKQNDFSRGDNERAKITVVATTYSISGKVSGDVVSGVTITLRGNGSCSTTTDSSGNYSFIGAANGNYTITASKTGCIFSPASRNVTVNNANVNGQNFTSTSNNSATYSISGMVSGAASSEVTITLRGASSVSTTTDSSGNYSFSGAANGNYTITASKTGYSFSPTSKSITVSNSDITGQNFVASAVNPNPNPFAPKGYVQGRVVDRCTLKPIVGAVVDIGVAKAPTDPNGQYSMPNVPATSYVESTSGSGWVGTYSATVDLTYASVDGVKIKGSSSFKYADRYYRDIYVAFSSLKESDGNVSTVSNHDVPVQLGNGNYDFQIGQLTSGISGDAVWGATYDSTKIAQSPVSSYVVALYSYTGDSGSTGSFAHRVAVTTTDISGHFSFSGLENGRPYEIDVVDSATVTAKYASYTLVHTLCDKDVVTFNATDGNAIRVYSTGN